jgi:hypothetical protein
MAEGLPEELQRAEKEGLAYTEVLLRLVRAQWHHRQETALEWRIRQARLPERWALETFPFKEQPAVNKRQIMSLAELDFIPTAPTVPTPTPQARAMARWGRRCSYFRRRISRTCLISSLSVIAVRALLGGHPTGAPGYRRAIRSGPGDHDPRNG